MSRVVTSRPEANTFMDSSSSGLYYVREEEEVSVDDPKMHQVLRSNVQQPPDYDMDDQDYRPYQDQSFFERSQNAKRIRREQLENWKRREEGSERPGKDHSKYDGLKQSGSLRHRKAKRKKTVMFEWNVLLMDAVLRDEVLEVDRLLSTYEELEHSPRSELVNCRSPDGLTPLHQCCIENLEQMAILLIRHGADLRAVDSELWSPLHAAATCGHLRMVRLLVDAVARTQKKSSSSDGTADAVREMLLAVNSDGNMPFDLCDNVQTLAFIENEMQQRGVTQNDIEARRHKKEVDMVRDLQQYLDSYARTSRPGSFRHRNSLSKNDSNRPMWESFIASSRMPNAVVMHIAAANGYLQAMDLLLKNKYPVDLEDEDGWLPIHAAVAWNQPEAAKRLVDAGADITAKVRGTNETALDLAYAADAHDEPGKAETFSDQLILWDTAYRRRCEEELAKKSKNIPRHPSSESVTSAPNSASPLLKRHSPKMSRVQRRSSLKDKEDLIALLHTLGAHDLKSSENNQGSLGLFVRSPGGSLRDRNPVLPTVSESDVLASSSAIIHVGQGDADLIDQTISPELISSLLRSFDTADDSADNESIAEQFLRDADEALNQIDQPVTLAQLKKNRNRFRMLKRKEKPFVKDSHKSHSVTQALIDDAKAEQITSCLPISSPTSKSLPSSPRQVDVSIRSNGILDSTELQRFTATQDERPVGAEGSGGPKLSNSFAKKKKDKMYNITGFRGSGKKDNKEPTSDEQKFRPIPSNGCCIIS